MTTIYVDEYTYPCQVIINIINLFSLDINIKNISEYKRNHYKVPVVEYQRKYIVYNNFSDLISILSKYHKVDISLDTIYDKIIKELYSNYVPHEMIRNLLKEKSIRFHTKNGYQLIHHFVLSNNHMLLKYCFYKYGYELKELLTMAYCDEDDNKVIGNQNVMHIANIKNKEMYDKYNKYLPSLQTLDNNNKYPKDY